MKIFKVLNYFLILLIFGKVESTPLEALYPPSSGDSELSESHFVHDKILCRYNLATNVVRRHCDITATAKGNKPVTHYFVIVPNSVKNLALVYVLDADTQSTLEMGVRGYLKTIDAILYDVKLSKPLKAGEKLRLLVGHSFPHAYVPVPSKIGQLDSQYIQFEGDAFFFSPYATEKYQLRLDLPLDSKVSSMPSVSVNDEHVSFKGEKNALIGEEINQGLPSYFTQEFTVGFLQNNPLMTLTSASREIVVSHLESRAGFSDSYALRHNGAALSSDFSRSALILHQMQFDQYFPGNTKMPAFNYINRLELTLPPQISNFQYRDQVGYIFNSEIVQQSPMTLVQLRPRFPLFGQWQTTFDLTYSAPLSQFLSNDGENFMFKIPFFKVFQDASVDDFTLRILLPSGARQPRVISPFTMDEQVVEYRYHYLDILSRPTVILKKKNVVVEHEQALVIFYSYPSWCSWVKPLALSVAFFSIFLAYSVLSRMSFSLGKQDAMTSVSGKKGSTVTGAALKVKTY